jgi:thiol-disulfide isomerase/thioredoxin
MGACAILGAMVACGPSTSSHSDPWVGREAPDFTVVSLEQPEPRRAKLSDYEGKVVLLEFWATWCGPCRAVMPEIERLHNTYKEDGLVVLAISDESETTLEKHMRSTSYTYPVYRDHAGMAFGAYEVSSLPRTVLVGRNGKIVWAELGADPEGMRKAVEAAIRG